MSFLTDLSPWIVGVLTGVVAAGFVGAAASYVTRLRMQLREQQMRVDQLQHLIDMQQVFERELAALQKTELSTELSDSSRSVLFKTLNDRTVSLTRAEIDEAVEKAVDEPEEHAQ